MIDGPQLAHDARHQLTGLWPPQLTGEGTKARGALATETATELIQALGRAGGDGNRGARIQPGLDNALTHRARSSSHEHDRVLMV